MKKSMTFISYYRCCHDCLSFHLMSFCYATIICLSYVFSLQKVIPISISHDFMLNLSQFSRMYDHLLILFSFESDIARSQCYLLTWICPNFMFHINFWLSKQFYLRLFFVYSFWFHRLNTLHSIHHLTR